jgi:opacity protein-like surface antigen
MASFKQSASFNLRRGLAALGAMGALALASAPAQAQVPGVDLYIGGGLGQSNLGLSASELGTLDFDEKDMAWKLFGGLRMASVFGVELAYIDFGKPNGDDAEVKYKGLAAFGMFYVPLPLPVLDIYAKAGLARLDADLEVGIDSLSTDDTKFAYGAGLQLKFGSLAIRGEYERFKVEDADPSLLSISFTKSFL